MITLKIARDVWEVLVREAGANDGDIARDQFIHYASWRTEVPEYRFCGSLGFGGKVRLLGGGHWHVYYYPEDVTDEREATRHRTNKALAEISTGE